MTPSRNSKRPRNTAVFVLSAVLLLQIWALPAALGQTEVPPVQGLEFDEDLLAIPWADPIEAFDLSDEPLAAPPDFDFRELHSSSVFEEGVENLAVAVEADIAEESVRHRRALQAVATAELALSTVEQNVAAAEDSIAAANQGVASARRSIERIEQDIAEADLEIADLNAADGVEVDEQSALNSDITQRNNVIVEMALRAFTGEDQALETLIADPESTIVLEQRIVIDQVRETQRSEIAGFEQEIAESDERRDALATELAPLTSATTAWAAEIVQLNGEIDGLIDDRVRLRSEIVDLEERGEELVVTIEETQEFAESTAAYYQIAYHQRLDAFVAGTDIPLVALNAYVRATRTLASEDPGCGIHWSQLAGIGRIESFHGYFGNSTLDVDGGTTQNIIGLALDGRVLSGGTTQTLPDATGRTQETSGVVRLALIRDSDNGALDGDRTYDRAVGPMQFIPTTWQLYGADGNNDGREDPQNIYDASLAAARYLCAAPGSMLTSTGEQRAYFAYNHDYTYSANVTRAGRGYHGQLDVSPESSAFTAFARLPIPERPPVTEDEPAGENDAPGDDPTADVAGDNEPLDDEPLGDDASADDASADDVNTDDATIDEPTTGEPTTAEEEVATEPASDDEPAVDVLGAVEQEGEKPASPEGAIQSSS